jgi:hypothetical protein
VMVIAVVVPPLHFERSKQAFHASSGESIDGTPGGISMRFLERKMTDRARGPNRMVSHRIVDVLSSCCSTEVMGPQHAVHLGVASGTYPVSITFPLKTLPMPVEPSRELRPRSCRHRCRP